MAVALALVSALAYGLSDFLGGVTSKRVTPWAVALVGQCTGAVLVLVVTLVDGRLPEIADLGWALVAGLGNGLGTAFLYRGLSAGRMGVVAPVSGVAATVVPVVAGLVGGERPALLVWAGIALAPPAIWLVSRPPASEREAGAGAGSAGASGLVDGLIAGAGFGFLFAALGQVPEDAGFLPLALNQVVAAVVIVLVATALGVSWRSRDPRVLGGAVTGALGAAATGAFLLATQRGYLSVVSVIASLYPASTVLLAAGLLGERIHRAQALGLALCGVAVTLVAVG